VGNEVREVGGGRYIRKENFGAEKRAEKSWVGEEDVFLVHPQNA